MVHNHIGRTKLGSLTCRRTITALARVLHKNAREIWSSKTSSKKGRSTVKFLCLCYYNVKMSETLPPPAAVVEQVQNLNARAGVER
jgi:hypothetical protein